MKMRRLTAAILAAVMTVSMGSAAFATEADTVGAPAAVAADLTQAATKVEDVKVVGEDGWTEVTAPQPGQKLTANVLTDGKNADGSQVIIGSYPVSADVEYKWYYKESPDNILGTAAVYTVTDDNLGKTLCVEVKGVTLSGTATWEAASSTAGKILDVQVVDGDDGYTVVEYPVAGQKLTANIITENETIGSYPRNPRASYKWYYAESPDTVLGTDPVYTVTSDNLDKTLCVEVNVDGYTGGPKTWKATSPVAVDVIKGVQVVDGDDGYTEVEKPVAGQKLIANIITEKEVIGAYPVNPKASYKWFYKESSDTVLGTDPVYTVTSDNLDKTLCVTVDVDGYTGGPITWEAGGKTEVVPPVDPDVDNDKPSHRGDYDNDEQDRWDEVKEQIAEADEGDTIKVNANGLPYFPRNVARALKGKDVTLEIRKNGVTYKVNGLEIGAIEKLWYEFEDLDELLTADTEADKPQKDLDTEKPNPDTGR